MVQILGDQRTVPQRFSAGIRGSLIVTGAFCTHVAVCQEAGGGESKGALRVAPSNIERLAYRINGRLDPPNRMQLELQCDARRAVVHSFEAVIVAEREPEHPGDPDPVLVWHELSHAKCHVRASDRVKRRGRRGTQLRWRVDIHTLQVGMPAWPGRGVVEMMPGALERRRHDQFASTDEHAFEPL